jgi:hypothetical protein
VGGCEGSVGGGGGGSSSRVVVVVIIIIIISFMQGKGKGFPLQA